MPSSVVGPGHVIAGRYRIERWLGQGGMGSVYQALQLSVQRTVALKRLVDEHLESGSHVERFEREALALSRLSHQSTVRLFDFGSDERGCPFIVMEYLQGRDLAADLELHGPMRWDRALALCIQILGSLAEAHASGIVHRDIKPANLFLCEGSEWPLVKVLDFGIAGGAEPRVGLRKLTLTGTVLGSAPYMSPEQAQGLPAGPTADLYSLGVVLFETLTGRTPFEARTLTAQLIAKVLEAAPSLRDVCPDIEVPSDVQALVASLLEREPNRRPPSARAAAERIEGLLGRAALPPLSRAAQRPKASQPIAKTEPMLVPRTIDDGWTPPKTPPPPRSRSRRAVGGGVLLVVAGGAAGSWRALREPDEPPQPQAALAAVEVLSALHPDGREAGEASAAFDAIGGGDAPAAALRREGSAPPLPAAQVQAQRFGEAERLSAPRAANAMPVGPRAKPSASRRSRLPARPPSESPATAAPAPATAVSAPATAAPVPLPSPPEASSSPALPAPATPSSTPATPALATAPAGATAQATPSTPSSAPTVTPEVLVLPPALPVPDAQAPATDPAGAPSPNGDAPASPEGVEPEPASPPPTPPRAERSEPPPGAPIVDPRYWTIAAARAAARRGDITPAQRNEIIVALRRRRLQARARAARAYREGRIGYAELLHRQHAIDRRFEGW